MNDNHKEAKMGACKEWLGTKEQATTRAYAYYERATGEHDKNNSGHTLDMYVFSDHAFDRSD